MRLDLRFPSMIDGPGRRRLRRTIGIAYMARHASWQARRHREGSADMRYVPEPDNPSRAAVYYQPLAEAPQDWPA